MATLAISNLTPTSCLPRIPARVGPLLPPPVAGQMLRVGLALPDDAARDLPAAKEQEPPVEPVATATRAGLVVAMTCLNTRI